MANVCLWHDELGCGGSRPRLFLAIGVVMFEQGGHLTIEVQIIGACRAKVVFAVRWCERDRVLEERLNLLPTVHCHRLPQSTRGAAMRVQIASRALLLLG